MGLSSEEQGEVAFGGCVLIYVVTAIGLAIAYVVQVERYRRAAIRQRDRERRKASADPHSPSTTGHTGTAIKER